MSRFPDVRRVPKWFVERTQIQHADLESLHHAGVGMSELRERTLGARIGSLLRIEFTSGGGHFAHEGAPE